MMKKIESLQRINNYIYVYCKNYRVSKAVRGKIDLKSPISL